MTACPRKHPLGETMYRENNMRLYKTFLLFIIYSFIGWCYESAYVSILEKKFVNRGFLYGPLLPIYGVGALLIILLLQKTSDNIISLFLSSAVLISVLEYLTSWGMEKLFNARWWDYSTHRFHINGRVCLDGAVVFGLFSVLLIKVVNPFINSLIDKYMSAALLRWSSIILFILFLTDLALTVEHLLNLRLRLKIIQEAYDKYTKQLSETKTRLAAKISDQFENSVFYTTAVQKLLGSRRFRDSRLLRAFPRVRFLNFREAWEKLKENIRK